MIQQIDLSLMEFIDQQILPRYASFGKSHGLFHVTRVIKNSIVLARQLGVDINMAYTIAAYHDLGMDGPRAIHHMWKDIGYGCQAQEMVLSRTDKDYA